MFHRTGSHRLRRGIPARRRIGEGGRCLAGSGRRSVARRDGAQLEVAIFLTPPDSTVPWSACSRLAAVMRRDLARW
jgi:hypothetical protein